MTDSSSMVQYVEDRKRFAVLMKRSYSCVVMTLLFLCGKVVEVILDILGPSQAGGV